MSRHVYTVHAQVLYSARRHRGLWMDEEANVLANGDVNAAAKKARRHFLKLRTEDNSGDGKYVRRATKVRITSVEQGARVDVE